MTKEMRAERILGWCSVIIIVLMFSSVALQIYARYFMTVAPAWTEEVGRYLLVWLTALGAGVALRSADGYRGAVDFIVNAMPSRGRHALNLVFMAIAFWFLCLLALKAFDLVIKKMEVRTAALELPVSFLYLGVSFMAALMIWGLLHHVRNEFKAFMSAADRKAEETEIPPEYGERSDNLEK